MELKKSTLEGQDLETRYYLNWALGSLDDIDVQPDSEEWHEIYQIRIELEELLLKIQSLEMRALQKQIAKVLSKYH